MILEMDHYEICLMQNLCIYFFHFRVCLVWNGPPQSIKHSESIYELKRKLKELGNLDCSCILCRWNC